MSKPHTRSHGGGLDGVYNAADNNAADNNAASSEVSASNAETEANLIIGWREWIELPALGRHLVEAKVDTGAESSSIHAVDIESFLHDGAEWVRFRIPLGANPSDGTVDAQARLLDRRRIRSSNGMTEDRPVIRTAARIGNHLEEIDVTLARRDEMGFRMLLGREAVQGRFLIDAQKSFLLGQPFQVRRAS